DPPSDENSPCVGIYPSNAEDFHWDLDDIVGGVSCFPTDASLQDVDMDVGPSRSWGVQPISADVINLE
ncbi:hypothetical protein A2U01_0060188, partial [Trifolium medium]|nr:hypothetical protein [Trifolium medium]